jgi:hypothetical protein
MEARSSINSLVANSTLFFSRSLSCNINSMEAQKETIYKKKPKKKKQQQQQQ